MKQHQCRQTITVKWSLLGSLIALALLTFGPTRLRALGIQFQRAAPATSRELSQADAAVDGLVAVGNLRVSGVAADTVLPGRSHERLDQYYRGVRVFGGNVVRQMAGGQTVSLSSRLYTNIGVEPSPTLTPDDVKTIVQGLSADAVSDSTPELVVLPVTPEAFQLTYRVRVKTPFDRVIYFVDANTGAIVHHYSDLQSQAAIGKGTGVFGDSEKISAASLGGQFVAEDLLRPPTIGTFDLAGNVARSLGFLNGVVSLGTSDLASSTNNTWTDGPDVDAHAYAGFTYDYYFKRFGRHGLDNQDLPITVITHPVRRADLLTASNDVIGLLYLNAFYAGDGVVVYGEGLPTGFVLSGTRQTVDYFAGGLDIVAHELSHGVTEFTSGLIYQNESGALNEAFSDIMGVSAKFFFRPAGSGIGQANYELGSDVFRPGGIRSFDNPSVFGDPDHYSKRFLGPDDNGGVHTNCTIVDHAFYLAIESGTNRTSGLSVQGVGSANREQIEKVFYRGFTLMLTPNATFSDARAATIQSARDLYGAGSAVERAVTQAWTAVGVN
jgi:Zn-dependent metalloprotease